MVPSAKQPSDNPHPALPCSLVMKFSGASWVLLATCETQGPLNPLCVGTHKPVTPGLEKEHRIFRSLTGADTFGCDKCTLTTEQYEEGPWSDRQSHTLLLFPVYPNPKKASEHTVRNTFQSINQQLYSPEKIKFTYFL